MSTRKRHLAESSSSGRTKLQEFARFNIARNTKLKEIYSFVSPQLSYQNKYTTTIFERCCTEWVDLDFIITHFHLIRFAFYFPYDRSVNETPSFQLCSYAAMQKNWLMIQLKIKPHTFSEELRKMYRLPLKYFFFAFGRKLCRTCGLKHLLNVVLPMNIQVQSRIHWTAYIFHTI